MKTKEIRINRFCVLFSIRSGSTWLIDLINSHPQIQAYREVFLNEPKKTHVKEWNKHILPETRFYDFKNENLLWRPLSTFKYLNSLTRQSQRYSSVGFKLSYGQLFNHPEILWKLILDRYKIIHMLRLNPLDVIISKQIAKRRQFFHTTEELKVTSVHLDINSLLYEINRQNKMKRMMRLLVKVLPVKTIETSYEDLYSERDMVLNRITEFLTHSPPTVHFTSSLKKFSKGHHWDKIENYEEVKLKLMGTRFETLIETKK
jgi:LPS sulfotransferase NodH